MQRFTSKAVSLAALVVAWTWTAQPAAAQQAGADSIPQGPIMGTVIAADTGAPLVGAAVAVAGTDLVATTDENGRFTIPGIAPGTYTLEISLLGYLDRSTEISVTAGAPAQVSVQLANDPRYSEVVVIVGSRTERTATETPVPVDVIGAEVIQENGFTETNQVLATAAPSYRANHQSVADGSDHVNPASMRGLGPDQVLVLVNGKRRHSSALVHSTDTFGRGTSGVDLNSIPATAIKRIEVLRDGAAAQYGSDAIAGVVNVVLKDYADLLEVTTKSGITGSGDGFELKVGANYGFRLGEDGVFNLTGEFLQRNPTDRSGPWSGSVYGADLTAEETDQRLAEAGLDRDDVSMRIGQSRATVGALMFNAAVPMAALDLYGFGGATYRNGDAAGFYRLPEEEERVDLQRYPNGFLPEIHTDIVDWSLGIGARTELAGWKLDLSANHGGNMFLFGVQNSVNASLGAAGGAALGAADGGTSFDAGGQAFLLTTVNADVVKGIDISAIEQLSLVMGSELRLENFRIVAGEEASYVAGDELTSDGQRKIPGSQVFPGYQPASELSEYRNSIGVYAGLESQLSERILLDVAGRFENYSDFGNTLTGKVAGRINLLDELAVRAAVSNGFRAPSLHQVWFTAISTQFEFDTDTGMQEARQVLAANNHSAEAAAFGIPALEEETSFNLSAGFTARPVRNLSLTADFYRITIDDRIVLTSRFSSDIPGVAAILEPFPAVSQAEFFTNAVDTETLGADLVADYTLDLGGGTLGVTGSANITKTTVQVVQVPDSVAEKFTEGDLDAVRDTIFSRQERNRLEDLLPWYKGSLTVRYGRGPATVLSRARYYGPSRFKGIIPEEDEYFGPKVLLDLDIGYQIRQGLHVSIGASNLLNTFPDEQQKEGNRYFDQFLYRPDQFGMNGGFYYVRLQYSQ